MRVEKRTTIGDVDVVWKIEGPLEEVDEILAAVQLGECEQCQKEIYEARAQEIVEHKDEPPRYADEYDECPYDNRRECPFVDYSACHFVEARELDCFFQVREHPFGDSVKINSKSSLREHPFK